MDDPQEREQVPSRGRGPRLRENDNDGAGDVHSVAADVHVLRAEVERVREGFLEYQVDRVVTNAVEQLGKKFWVLAVVAGVAGLLGVPLSARAFLDADTRKLVEATTAAHEAAKRLDEQSKSVEAEAQKARDTVAAVKDAAAQLEARLADVDARISELRGELGRASSAGDLRLDSLRDQLGVLASALNQTSVTARLEERTREEQRQRDAFEARGKVSVRIVYHARSKKKAQSVQADLASRGYATHLLASDVAELGPSHAQAGEVMVLTHPDEARLGSEISHDLGLTEAAKPSATLKSGNVQVLVF